MVSHTLSSIAKDLRELLVCIFLLIKADLCNLDVLLPIGTSGVKFRGGSALRLSTVYRSLFKFRPKSLTVFLCYEFISRKFPIGGCRWRRCQCYLPELNSQDNGLISI